MMQCYWKIFWNELRWHVWNEYYVYFCLGKTQKLKRAKEEAQAEIRNYREEREKQFVEYQREVSLMHGAYVYAQM